MNLQALYSPLPGHARWSTVAMAAAILVTLVLARRRPLIGFVAVIAWLAVYETYWEAGQLLYHRETFANFFWLVLAWVGWMGCAWKLGIRLEGRWAALFAATAVAWLATGFHVNWWWQRQGFDVVAEALNTTSKTALGLAFLLGTLRLPRRNWVSTVPCRTLATPPTPAEVSLVRQCARVKR